MGHRGTPHDVDRCDDVLRDGTIHDGTITRCGCATRTRCTGHLHALLQPALFISCPCEIEHCAPFSFHYVRPILNESMSYDISHAEL